MDALHPVVLKINIPFCSRIPSFVSRPQIEGRNTKLIHQYIMAVALEIRANAAEFTDCQVQAIRLGGGSASIVDGKDTEQLLRLVRKTWSVADDVPVSMRTCPADINGANMPFYNRAHIGRFDLELYSLEPQDFCTLDTLNYMEQLPYISQGFLRAGQTGKMGFVLLYGKRHISRWGFRRSILETIRRPVSHVLLQKCGGDDCLTDEECAAQLQEASQLLGESGYTEYLPQRWAKPGREDRFWQLAAAGTDVLSFGLGAVTRIDGVCSTTTSDLNTYLHGSSDYRAITVSVEKSAEP